MGSGETTPTLARVHRSILGRLGPAPVPAVLVDTPYGFQENADDLSGRTIDYFRDSVGNPIGVATLRSADVDAVGQATAAARIREARYVFSGPGSPSYALRHWRGSDVPRLIADKLARGGAVTFASAAALTLGVRTIPVYEIYKVGEPPHWLEGLDLLSALGLPVAVIPHYDNAEGGNHDTRFCYLGERRLATMERELPDGTFILGVDGHTALILDLDAGSATVTGHGGVTVRAGGRSVRFPGGSTVAIAALADAARAASAGEDAGSASASLAGLAVPGEGWGASGAGAGAGVGLASDAGAEARVGLDAGLADVVEHGEREFELGVEARDPGRCVRAILGLEEALAGWSRETGLFDDRENARAVLRSLVVRLGELAADGTRDPRDAVRPFVDALLLLRGRARVAGDWETADVVRDRLVASGVAVHDSPDGTSWELSPGGG